jgi:hypothetical protein
MEKDYRNEPCWLLLGRKIAPLCIFRALIHIFFLQIQAGIINNKGKSN